MNVLTNQWLMNQYTHTYNINLTYNTFLQEADLFIFNHMYWYEEEVKQLEKAHRLDREHPGVIFYGSSSIRLWNSLEDDFDYMKVTNLGFGGSTLAACVWFFERIMADYRPKALVVYAGDNDLGDGRNPEEIFIFFQQLMVKVNQRFGILPCYFISLKPSLTRWQMADQFRYTNNLIESEIIKLNNHWKFIDVFKKMLNKDGNPNSALYDHDGLHLSEEGYRLWASIIRERLG
ncbi:lysophospholipase L1-like esterase [Pedobacter sp. W3I1]|uniref:GDSL-type esterase/lipase family protein n=1 Tax=Pedobacter sp. W3I1 TaxID=3042291 RepID=UPI00278674E5|nr:GDSL-type esterase/lipase family protein [Pedobacter sp. W3I1]MDQ0638964.1 lysophospholipase L1-like esterase [Pedobacter sp. W3I1]